MHANRVGVGCASAQHVKQGAGPEAVSLRGHRQCGHGNRGVEGPCGCACKRWFGMSYACHAVRVGESCRQSLTMGQNGTVLPWVTACCTGVILHGVELSAGTAADNSHNKVGPSLSWQGVRFSGFGASQHGTVALTAGAANCIQRACKGWVVADVVDRLCLFRCCLRLCVHRWARQSCAVLLLLLLLFTDPGPARPEHVVS